MDITEVYGQVEEKQQWYWKKQGPGVQFYVQDDVFKKLLKHPKRMIESSTAVLYLHTNRCRLQVLEPRLDCCWKKAVGPTMPLTEIVHQERLSSTQKTNSKHAVT